MTIFCLGSINADHVYRVPHLPHPGETLAAHELQTGLGGKGANQSVAAAKAGALVIHIGAVGADGQWAKDRIEGYGVDVDHVSEVSAPTGHAIINVDPGAENAIVLFQGANIVQSEENIRSALSQGQSGDVLILQNETSHQVFAAKIAQELGMRVMYSAAPFDVDAATEMLPFTTVLALNEVEAEQLCAALNTDLASVPVPEIVLTKGSAGAEWFDLKNGKSAEVSAFSVTPVDTTGAGDTFAGYVAAGLDQGRSTPDAMQIASAASAIKVTRHGTADAIPSMAEVEAFLDDQ
ncbi:ribokinase [Cochlodiniinecator piscidefendens]|uniref:ribokinase n=1 Tax=Cochlodiniinecator piscidefendens TaxID=2715756 RepID=UPI00140A33D6|nr:ribokinase [Cochlodiniinecator piscidefendens]